MKSIIEEDNIENENAIARTGVRKFSKSSANELQRFAQENLIKQRKNSTEDDNSNALQQSDLDENAEGNLTDSESERSSNESSRSSSISEAYSPGSNRRNSDSNFMITFGKLEENVRRNSTASTYSLQNDSATSRKIEEKKEEAVNKEVRGFGNHSAVPSRNASPELNRELLNNDESNENTSSSASQPRKNSSFKDTGNLDRLSWKLKVLKRESEQNDSLITRRNSVEIFKKNELSPFIDDHNKRSHSVQYEIYNEDDRVLFKAISSDADNFIKKLQEQRGLNNHTKPLKTKSNLKSSTSDSEEFSDNEDNTSYTEKSNTNVKQKIASLKLSKEQTMYEADLNSYKRMVNISEMNESSDKEWSDDELEYPVAEDAPTPGSLPLDHLANPCIYDEGDIVDKLAGLSLQNSDENK